MRLRNSRAARVVGCVRVQIKRLHGAACAASMPHEATRAARLTTHIRTEVGSLFVICVSGQTDDARATIDALRCY